MGHPLNYPDTVYVHKFYRVCLLFGGVGSQGSIAFFIKPHRICLYSTLPLICFVFLIASILPSTSIAFNRVNL